MRYHVILSKGSTHRDRYQFCILYSYAKTSMRVQCAVYTWIIVVIDGDWQLLRILHLKLLNEVHCESYVCPS